MQKLTIDFETRSEISLYDRGAWIYSRHPSTEVMCMGWSSENGPKGQWRMGDALPHDLFAEIAVVAEIVEAHNAFFEYCIWLNVCHHRYGWPAVPDEMWRCSAALAASFGLPRDLGGAGNAMGLATVKDEEYGKWAMQKLSRPRKPTKNDPSRWHDAEEDWQKMLAYNVNDVVSEEALSASLIPLPPAELAAWQMSERMNRRGFGVDVDGCRAAVKIAAEYGAKLTAEFRDITGLESAGQRAKFIVWLNLQGFQVNNTQAATLDDLLAAPGSIREEPNWPKVQRAVEIVRALGRSSVKKYGKLLAYADGDHRARGCLLFNGAHTGRWAGSGPQPQNFKRECPWDMDRAWEDVLAGDEDLIELLYGDPLAFLSHVTRGAICAAPGRVHMAGDYAQIEPRVLFWLSGERRGLAAFAAGDDVYVEMATTILGGHWHCAARHDRYTKKCVYCDAWRFLGKHAILALGYGAGFVKFLLHCRDLGAPEFTAEQIRELVPADERDSILTWILNESWDRVRSQIPDATRADATQLVLTKYIVDKYRERYRDTVCKFWRDCEDAFRNALRNPGRTFYAGRVAYTMGKKFMSCRLPSGRVMRYCDPRADGELSYMASEDGQWRRTKTYGGKLAENIVQAVSRDIMVDGMTRLETHPPYHELVLTVHDEVICEIDEGVGSHAEFLEIMSAPPTWAADLPVKVEGFCERRYRK